MNNDFSTAIVCCDLAHDFNPSALQRSEISKAGTVRCKYDTAKTAIAVVLAKIQKGAARTRGKNAQHPPFNTGVFSRMKAGLWNSNASFLRTLAAAPAGAFRGVAQAEAVSQE